MDQTTNETRRQPSIEEVRAHVQQDIADLRQAAERRSEELIGQARTFIDQHPLLSVAAAFGAGYLLSGALLSRATLRLAVMGARWYAGRMVRDFIQAGEAALAGGASEPGMAAGGAPERAAEERA